MACSSGARKDRASIESYAKTPPRRLMRPATLLADPTAIRPEKIVQNGNSLVIVVTARRARAECPRCRLACTRVHSRYVRTVADLPCQGVALKLELHARRFRCENILCVTSIFCEDCLPSSLIKSAGEPCTSKLIGRLQ